MRAAVAAAVGLAVLAAPVAGQQNEDVIDLLEGIAVLWNNSDAAGLAARGARDGLNLEVHGQLMGSLEGRRAAAALRQIFGNQETVSVEMGTASKVMGTEDRAFGELIWGVRLPGATAVEYHKIFVAFLKEESGWHISEIRILR